ncbi:MAG: DNA internalization-related competence protein ComEC/Rec2 [Lachnospiraceae bacterium]|nr:DNA internalization-related competence protein ComEC/Rec2 [Lachnospiraceae bacterium]
MNKRPVLMAASAMLGGTILILYHQWIFLMIPILLLPFIFYRRQLRHALMLTGAVILAFVCGITSASVRQTTYANACRAINSSDTVTIHGRLIRKERTSYGIRNYLSLKGAHGIRVSFTSEEDICPVGSWIRVTGAPVEPEPQRNPGCSDQKSYYRSRSIASTIKDAVYETTSVNRFSIFELLYLLKYQLLAVFNAALPGEEGSILASLSIGTRGLLDEEAKELLTNAGLSHILAISGLHISIMGNMVYSTLMKLKLSVRPSALISFVFVFLYAYSISDSVSAERAVIMYLLFIISKFFIEKTDTLTSLAFAVIYVCITDPLAITGAAFVMSFAAVFLIAVLAVPAGRCYRAYTDLRWENTHKRIKGSRHKPTFMEDMAASVLFSFCIQISMGAISAGYFYTFPLLSCLLNTVVLPFLPFLIITGLIGGVIGLFCLPLAKIVLFPCHLILYWYELSSATYTRIPLSNIVTGRISVPKLIICLIIVLVISIILRSQNRRLFNIRFTKRTWTKLKLFPVFGSRKATLSAAALSCAIIILLSVPHHEGSLAMLDVGQGDGLILTTADGRGFMFDGGSSTEHSIGKNILLPSLKYRGLSSVEGWFLTHLDDDHISGFTELVEKDYPIRNLYLSSRIPHDEKYAMIVKLCSEHGIQINYLDGNDSLTCPLFTIETLFPDQTSDFEGPNENSLVTLVTMNWKDGSRTRIIETGDIGEDQEKYILEKYSARIRKSSHDTLILKSAHHGSNYSNCSEWLSGLRPDLVLISAGAGNRYGHPGGDTLSRLNDTGLRYLCTISTGQISLLPSGRYRCHISRQLRNQD